MKIKETEFYIWASAVASGVALGGALVLSRTPVVGAYIGAVMPLIIAVTAFLTSEKKGERADDEAKRQLADNKLLLVSKFVFAFFIAAIFATVIGFFVRPTDSIISNVDRDLANLNIGPDDRVELIKSMLKSGKLSVSENNTRAEGFVLYTALNTPTKVTTRETNNVISKLNCKDFPSPPWSANVIGQMSTHQSSWKKVGQTLVEIDRLKSLADGDRSILQRLVYGLLGC